VADPAQTTDQAVVLVGVVGALFLELVVPEHLAKDPMEVLAAIPMERFQAAAVEARAVLVAFPPQTSLAALAVLVLLPI
jgi:hypothetical protein